MKTRQNIWEQENFVVIRHTSKSCFEKKVDRFKYLGFTLNKNNESMESEKS